MRSARRRLAPDDFEDVTEGADADDFGGADAGIIPRTKGSRDSSATYAAQPAEVRRVVAHSPAWVTRWAPEMDNRGSKRKHPPLRGNGT